MMDHLYSPFPLVHNIPQIISSLEQLTLFPGAGLLALNSRNNTQTPSPCSPAHAGGHPAHRLFLLAFPCMQTISPYLSKISFPISKVLQEIHTSCSHPGQASLGKITSINLYRIQTGFINFSIWSHSPFSLQGSVCLYLSHVEHFNIRSIINRTRQKITKKIVPLNSTINHWT